MHELETKRVHINITIALRDRFLKWHQWGKL